MDWVVKGIGFGLFLTILVGPILFALIQEGIEKGFRAGISVGLGIWISDLLFIIFVYWGLSIVSSWIETPSFQFILGIAGSIMLFIIGLATIFSKAPIYEKAIIPTPRRINYFSLSLKGFLINTINPFTVAFWTGIMTTVVLKENLTKVETGLFLGSILLTIIITDTIKVVLAKKIRPYLKPHYVLRIRQVAGGALIVFGIIMLGRVLYS